MSTVLSSGASIVLSGITVSSTRVSPSVNLNVTNAPSQLSYEVIVTVPDTGSISLMGEASTNGGASWFPISIDGFNGGIPKATGSSQIRSFSRYQINSTGTVAVRGRVTDVTGTWVIQSVRVELQ